MRFKIKPINGKAIARHKYVKGVPSCVVHWVVYIVDELHDDYIFLRSFLSEFGAENYIREVKKYIAMTNDYSVLRLRG